jgi:hypothetical protein
MAYGDFSFDDIESKFGIKNKVKRLFDDFEPIMPSERLIEALEMANELPVRSEKAKSETIVFPVLIELRKLNNKFFTIYSGDNLNVDEAQGLRGECDFILSKDIGSFSINFPILQIVEAKKNDLDLGIPQCAAQLIGAKIFNERKGIFLDSIYGCVTTGNDWVFLKLENDILIDNRIYYLNEIGEILAVFQQIIDYYKQNI